jgi:hypothetical protein
VRPQVTPQNPAKPLQIKVTLSEPLRSQFLELRDLMSEDNAGLARYAIREIIERKRQPALSVPIVTEDKNLTAFNAEQEAQRREFYQRPGTLPPGEQVNTP